KASKLLGPIAVKRDQEHMRQRLFTDPKSDPAEGLRGRIMRARIKNSLKDGDRLLGPRNDSNNNNYIRFKLNQTIYDYRLPKEKVKRNISSFTFLNQARRSLVEPSTNNNDEGEGYIEINSTKYHKLRKTHPIATNTYSA
ncbi:hypothetical protein PSTT_06956, partial [Puccinia striiformis]